MGKGGSGGVLTPPSLTVKELVSSWTAYLGKADDVLQPTPGFGRIVPAGGQFLNRRDLRQGCRDRWRIARDWLRLPVEFRPARAALEGRIAGDSSQLVQQIF